MSTYQMVYGDSEQVVRETFKDVEVEREDGWVVLFRGPDTPSFACRKHTCNLSTGWSEGKGKRDRRRSDGRVPAVADWATISSLATAGGTLVLAMATFSAVRSSNRSARIAEQALRTGMRPLFVQSRPVDPDQKVLWSDRHAARLSGGRAIFEEQDGVIYLAMAVRNVGAGIGLMHAWYPMPERALADDPHADPEEFRRLTIDLYVPASDVGYWEGAVRDADDPLRPGLLRALAERRPFTIDLLYGDQEGGQRTISRFTVLPTTDDGWFCQVGRHWNVDRPDPR